jgi:hypothetical protein
MSQLTRIRPGNPTRRFSPALCLLLLAAVSSAAAAQSADQLSLGGALVVRASRPENDLQYRLRHSDGVICVRCIKTRPKCELSLNPHENAI